MTAMFHMASSFNQNLSSWCVELIAYEPTHFDEDADAWTLDRPSGASAHKRPQHRPSPRELSDACQVTAPTLPRPAR